ncbi:MAG: hypothetical protein PHS40_01600 [Mariniphaga sp.]|nr:hypothetical protein [Mariniphaga sp.]MDD4424600.1 hypothetical protein [Mariniphaga sp.]
MTEEDRLLLNDLNAHVKRLFQEYENLKNENKLLLDKLDILTGEIARIEQEKEKLKEKIENLNIANRLLAGNDKDGEVKKRINTFIREIDRCIALLNK